MAFIGCIAPGVRTQTTAPVGRLEPREVLALSSTAHDDIGRAEIDAVHQLLELPLQHLGLVLRSRNVTDGEPGDLDPRTTRAVLTWFGGDPTPVPWLMPWLERQRARNRQLRFVHLSDLGPLEADAQTFTRWIEPFGFIYRPGFTDDPLRIDVEFHERAATHFEATPNRRFVHQGPRSVARDHSVWITTRDRLAPNQPRTPVVTGKFGGLALRPWTLREGTADQDRRWLLNPFTFLSRALGTEHLPAPEPNVAFGRRVFVLHVDGDGFESQATTRPGQLSAEVFRDEIIDRYRVPMTVSVIVASLTDDLAVDRPNPRMELAKQILTRPWVEPASHSVLHPLNWRRKLTAHTPSRTVNWYDPIANYHHDMVAEVRESIAFVDRLLAGTDKRCALMLWSGMANPSEAVLRAAHELGCANLNGGVCRFDAGADSLGYVSPWSKRVGSALQVYCGAANENVFPGFFTELPSVFRHVDTTIERTGAPRILKPANVYVHFYSAERPARLRALHDLLQRWVEREPTIPLPASRYARAVAASQEPTLQIVATATGFEIDDCGECRCLRLPGADWHLDWRSSHGVIGARTMAGSLYLQLAGPQAKVAFQQDAPPQPHLEQSDHELRDVHRDAHGVRFTSHAFRPRYIALAGFTANAALDVHVGAAITPRSADADGRIELQLPAGDDRIEVRSR